MSFFGGSGGGGGNSAAKPATPTPTTAQLTQAAFNTNGLSTEFPAENPVRMPVYNSPAQLEAARVKMGQITSRSGRSSTQLVPGTSTYAASFLGNLPGGAQ